MHRAAIGLDRHGQNWQKYREYRSDARAMLFEGKYFRKIPHDVEMDIGPTVVYPLPRNYAMPLNDTQARSN
jgi:hypothetical protein